MRTEILHDIKLDIVYVIFAKAYILSNNKPLLLTEREAIVLFTHFGVLKAPKMNAILFGFVFGNHRR
jgi:hypothetical protein